MLGSGDLVAIFVVLLLVFGLQLLSIDLEEFFLTEDLPDFSDPSGHPSSIIAAGSLIVEVHGQ